MARPCRACQNPIKFIEALHTGRPMPVDPDLTVEWVLIGDHGNPEITLITERGATIRGRRVTLTHKGAEKVEGYVPHWVTCTHPERFRSP